MLEWGVEGRCVREGEPVSLASLLCFALSATMTEQEVPSSVARRIIMKFLTNEGFNPQEILTHLKAQLRTLHSQNWMFT